MGEEKGNGWGVVMSGRGEERGGMKYNEPRWEEDQEG